MLPDSQLLFHITHFREGSASLTHTVWEMLWICVVEGLTGSVPTLLLNVCLS